MKQIALILIRIYRLIFSPLLGHHCRFFPTCSVYAYQAIEKYGFVKGIILGIKRLFKCHPLHPGGIDFVP
ncbi:MAG: membrane protein insertion efficiency factor YidD [Candidatus Aminicenantes bacterium]|nr:membrane protein insertion efficiency factor YidD [Candidatus Aminicenantes bacterium]